MACINKNHPEILKMAEELNVSPAVLSAKIGLWQEKNNITDRFPTTNELNNNIVTDVKTIDFSNITSNNETTIFENITSSKAEVENQEENYITENNELLLGGQPKLELRAEEVLRNIISSTQIDNFKEVTFFLEKAFNLLNKSGAKFKIIDNNKFNEMSSKNGEIQNSTIMLFDSVNNIIYSSKEKLSIYTPEQTTEAFIHEVVHSVSVKAYFDPQTFAEHQFKQFIDESYEQYKYLSEELDDEGNQMYGFTNQAEFIAEIYSNPKFRSKIESLEKGWLQRLIDNIRRFLELPLSIVNNNIIKSSLLFSKVDGFIENENNPYSKWKGTIFNNPKYEVFAKIDESQKTNLQTIEDKINNSLEKINESLSININKYKKLISSFEKKGYNTSGLSFVNDNLTELRDTINEFEENEKILGILTFLDDMGSTLDYVEKKLKSINNEDTDKIKSIIKIQDDYLSTYNVINDIKDLVASLSETKSDVVTDEELQEMQNLLDKHLGKYERLTREIYELKKRISKEKLLNIKYFPEIEKKHYDRLAIEHRNNKIAFDKNQWIIEKMTGRDKDLINADLEEAVNKFLNNPTYDIYSGDVLFNSAINVSSPMIQIMNNILNQIDNNRIEEERTKDLEFKKLFDELVTEKGTNNISTLYENIIEKDDTGNYFLKNEYKIEFYNEVVKKIKNLRSEIYFGTQELQKQQSELIKEGKENTPEYLNLIAEIQNLKISKEAEIEKIEKDNLELNEETRYVPKKKWLNNKKLSTTEQKVLEFFNQITLQSAKDTYFQESLIKNGYGTSFYELPKITKSFTERVFQGDVINGVKDNWTDLTTVRPDDIGYTTLERDMSGNPIYKIPIHYRSNENFKSTDQSLDLFNIYRLEYKNGNTFKHRNNVETDLHFLLDIAKDLKYYKNTGTLLELNSRNKKLTLIEGDQSQTIKMLTNMMETKFYDILNKNGTKVGNVELNKAVTKLNGMTSFLALSLNIASGTANVLNGSSQLFLESFLKGQTIKASSIAKAESFYLKDMMNIVADQTNSINISFTNQVLEMFNIKGDRSLSQANFLRSDMLKKGLNAESLQIIQSTGEHWLNSIITFSVLDGVKVMDENHNYLTKEGKITTNLSEAASVLDMLDKNENNLVKLKDSVTYTTHSKLVKWNEGGKEMIDALLYKKIYDMIGNYRSTDQSEIYRHWGGKLTMLYRKYLVPMGIARLRGIETSLKRKDDLEEKDRRFSYALQEYEEGTYTTLIRYIKSSVKDGQRWLTLKDNWNNLTDYEQHNVKKAVTEIILTSILTPLAVMFAGAAAEDDDELMYFIAYQLRRLDTELSAYRSIEESFKTLRSPIPSTRFLEHSLWSINSVLNPLAWENLTEVYKTGPHKGKNKFLIKQQKQLPLVKEFLKNWEDLYEFQSKPVAGFGK